MSAVAAAGGTGLAIAVLRLLRRETLRQAAGRVVGLAFAAAFAAWSGEARAFFLPGIYADASCAVVPAGSALVGRLRAWTLYGLLYGRRGGCEHAALRRVFVIATVGWSLFYAVRAAVQAVLYPHDSRPCWR